VNLRTSSSSLADTADDRRSCGAVRTSGALSRHDWIETGRTITIFSPQELASRKVSPPFGSTRTPPPGFGYGYRRHNAGRNRRLNHGRVNAKPPQKWNAILCGQLKLVPSAVQTSKGESKVETQVPDSFSPCDASVSRRACAEKILGGSFGFQIFGFPNVNHSSSFLPVLGCSAV